MILFHHFLKLHQAVYQRIRLVLSSLSRFLSFIPYLLGSIVVWNQSCRIFLNLVPSSSTSTTIACLILHCHLLKLLPQKELVPAFRSRRTCICPIVSDFSPGVLQLLCRLIISTASPWSSWYLWRATSYCNFSTYTNHFTISSSYCNLSPIYCKLFLFPQFDSTCLENCATLSYSLGHNMVLHTDQG